MSATDQIIAIIKALADERETFTTDDIRPRLPEGVSVSSIPAAVGKARRDGVVEEVERVKSQIPERKGSLVPVLRRPGSRLSLIQSASTDSSSESPVLSAASSEIVQLKDYLNATGYVCGIEEIATVLLFFAARTWVVLAGPSGTGKSSLIRRLSSALGAEFHDVQVKPNWISSEDSLGYFSELSGHFAPGVACKALEAAQAKSDKFHFIRFDELNLASPEYYLAELLSAGESWSMQEDGRMASDVVQMPPVPNGIESRTIRIFENAFMVGTINVDETTRVLSPKVLDRAAVLELQHVDLFALSSTPPALQSASLPALPAVRKLLSDRAHSIQDLKPTQFDVDRVASVLSNLSSVGAALGGPIGYRQRDAILAMLILANRHGISEILTDDVVIDIGIRSCIIPKWQGSTVASAVALKRALEVLLEKDLPADLSHEQMQALAATSRFPRSAEKINGMIRQFTHLGYFSAW